MICVQLLCATVLVAIAAASGVAHNNDLTAACVLPSVLVSISGCQAGAARKGREHEVEDEASLLQVKVHSDGQEQTQAGDASTQELLVAAAAELGATGAAHPALSTARAANLSSELVKPPQTIELAQELLALAQASSLAAARGGKNFTEAAGDNAVKQQSLLGLLQSSERTALLDLSAMRSSETFIWLGLLVVLLCVACVIVAFTGVASPKNGSDRPKNGPDRPAMRRSDDSPSGHSPISYPRGAQPVAGVGASAKSQPQSFSSQQSAFPVSNPLLASATRAKASSRGTPVSGSQPRQGMQGGGEGFAAGTPYQRQQGLADLPDSRPGTSFSSAASSSNVPGSMVPTGAPGMPLCPSLIIPDGTRLACVVQNDLKRTKQSMAFDVRSVVARGGAPLFRIHVSELSEQRPGIMVETLDGTEQLAFLSTEDLWNDSRTDLAPVCRIYRPKGALYGTVQKNAFGDYQVLRGQTCLMTISGDFAKHKIEVTASNGRMVAHTQQSSPEEYQVNVQSRIDAGLVVLSLLAVDKCQ